MRRANGIGVLGRAIAGELAAGTSAAARHRLLPQAAAATLNSRSLSFAGRFSDGFSQSKTLIPSTNHAFPATACFSSGASPAKEPQSSEKFLAKDVVLYQYEACPFCNKVKAFLDYQKIPYKVVEVNPINKKEIKWSDYKKVPILKVDGENLVDSSDIIDNLSQRINPENPALDSEEEKKWRRWVDNHLVHVLSPNIYRTASEALESFDYITSHGNFSFSERIIAKYGGATAMYFVSKKLKKRHNITDERAALYEAVETWVDALKGRQFIGGSSPNIADISVFGVLRPIRHLQCGKDMVGNTRIGEWYNRMERAVGESSRINA